MSSNEEPVVGVERTQATQLGNPSSDADDWVDPSPRSRRRDSMDEKKKKKKRKKKRKVEKKPSYFGAGGDGSEQGDEGLGRQQREDLASATSRVDFVPPPPRSFSVNASYHVEKKRRDTKQLSVQDQYAQPSRPGVFSVHGDVETGPAMTEPVMTDLASTGSSNAGIYRRGDDENEPHSLSSGDAMAPSNAGVYRRRDDENDPHSLSSGNVVAQAELVSSTVIAAVATNTNNLSQELKDRVRMLEDAQREGQEQRRQSKKRVFCAFLLLALMGGAIGIILVVVSGKSDPPPASVSPTTQPSSYPTLSPSLVPSSTPTIDLGELWATLIQSESPATTFFDTTSPEYQALDWMVQDPVTRSLFNDTDRVIQRFALAVLLYATRPSFGSGWLDETPECGWDIGQRALLCDRTGAVVQLDFAELRLTGTLPKEIGLLSALTHLGFDDNELEGTIPTEIGKLTRLTHLSFSYLYRLDKATIPTEIGLLTRLDAFIAGMTPLEGTIPTEIGKLLYMEMFAIYDNGLTGTLPTEIGLMTSLSVLDVAGNSITGTVPSEIANLTKLEGVHFYGTNLSGTIPSSLCAPRRSFWIDCGTINCTCCSGTFLQEEVEECDSPTN